MDINAELERERDHLREAIIAHRQATRSRRRVQDEELYNQLTCAPLLDETAQRLLRQQAEYFEPYGW